MRILPFLLIAACTSSAPEDTIPGNGSDGTDAESCDVIDCNNPACADEGECVFPSVMSQDTALVFVGREIECSAGPFPIPVDVPDCATRFTVNMMERMTGDLCPVCDITYEGTLAYTEDSCSELLETDAPTSSQWGFVHISSTERELWTNDTGSWALSETLTGASGVFTFDLTEAVNQDPPECNNGMQYVGDITVSIAFEDSE
jgi:hypothetical protein